MTNENEETTEKPPMVITGYIVSEQKRGKTNDEETPATTDGAKDSPKRGTTP